MLTFGFTYKNIYRGLKYSDRIENLIGFKNIESNQN